MAAIVTQYPYRMQNVGSGIKAVIDMNGAKTASIVPGPRNTLGLSVQSSLPSESAPIITQTGTTAPTLTLTYSVNKTSTIYVDWVGI